MTETPRTPYPRLPVASDLNRSDLGRALVAGWCDFAAHLGYGLFFKSIYVLGGLLAWYALVTKGPMVWLIPLSAGFPLIAPFTAIICRNSDGGARLACR